MTTMQIRRMMFIQNNAFVKVFYWMMIKDGVPNANTEDVYTNVRVLLDDRFDRSGVNLIGASCDDNNANTDTDVYTEQCVCQGVLLDDDKDGVPNSEDRCPELDDNLIGSSCDDNNANTDTDVYTEQCVCQGVLLDDDKDGVPNSEDRCPGLDDNLIGSLSCDDNVPNSEDKCPGR